MKRTRAEGSISVNCTTEQKNVYEY
uniref:Uncharacterized protein n=1 Tax=Arundo donax TaxID=35708 RepID=A0A0A9FVM9_ARUDO